MTAYSHEDEDLRAFREEYPDVYEFVVKVANGTCDDQAMQDIRDEYGDEFFAIAFKIAADNATGKDIETFREEWGDDIYLPLRKIIQQKKTAKVIADRFQQSDDEHIRYLRRDVPDVYGFVLQQLGGLHDEKAADRLKQDYDNLFYNDLMRVIHDREDEGVIKRFKEEYHEDVYIAIKNMMAARPKPVPPPAEPTQEPRTLFKKGNFIGQKYEVFDMLGEGGFGIVYLVYSHETKSAYALKTFRDEYLADINTRERFRKEAQVWIDLERHPYLVRAYFVDDISGRLYIAMEHIAADERGLNTLDAYLRKQPPDLAQTLRWAVQFCYGMEHAYSKGIKAHRDIKPANIMIDQHKNVKISDFGLAGIIGASGLSSAKTIIREISGRDAYQTVAGTALGTPPYMPPEQFENAAGCDERSDIYSFGIVLYQMVSGGPLLPFYPDMAGKKADNSFQEWYKLHCTAAIPKLNSPLFPVIQKCLEKYSNKRYQTFGELRITLASLLVNHVGEVIKPTKVDGLDEWEFVNKGLSLCDLGRPQDAILWFNRALEINPWDSNTWHSKGVALERLGKIEEAIACYDRALELNPVYTGPWANKGLLLSTLGRHQEAIACCNNGVSRDRHRMDKSCQAQAFRVAGRKRKGRALD